MENKKLNLVKRLVLTGAFSALIIVLTFTNLGFISFSPVVSITILPIPVVLVALLAGLPEGIFAGFIFGLMSLIKAAMSPTGVLDPLFVNPLCSILPRMLFAVVAWAVWKIFKAGEKITKEACLAIALVFAGLIWMVASTALPVNIAVGCTVIVGALFWLLMVNLKNVPAVVAAAITGFVATFAHTLLVYGCIFIFKGADMRAALDSIGMSGLGYFAVVGVGLPSEISEALATLVVCAAVFGALAIAGNRRSKLSAEADE